MWIFSKLALFMQSFLGKTVAVPVAAIAEPEADTLGRAIDATRAEIYTLEQDLAFHELLLQNTVQKRNDQGQVVPVDFDILGKLRELRIRWHALTAQLEAQLELNREKVRRERGTGGQHPWATCSK